MTLNQNAPKSPIDKAEQYRALVKKIAEQVWELWRQDLRREQERRGKPHRS